MQRAADDAHLRVALNPALPKEEEEGASELDKLLEEGGGEEAGEADAAAAAARPLTATPSADVDVARRGVARWRAFVAERKACPLLVLREDVPDLFEQEVLTRLDPTDRTMLAQVGRPWLAAVLASGLPRLPRGSRLRLRLKEFCTSAERLAWAKANGCPWGNVPSWFGSKNPCALAVADGHLEALQWARAHGCPWHKQTMRDASRPHPETEAWIWAQPE